MPTNNETREPSIIMRVYCFNVKKYRNEMEAGDIKGKLSQGQ
jgi:hypothetical protein